MRKDGEEGWRKEGDGIDGDREMCWMCWMC